MATRTQPPATASAAAPSIRLRAPAALLGRNPTNPNRSATNPLATRAVSTAEGPGSTVTGTPAASAVRTSQPPGSEIPGIPASETSAIRSPASSRGKSSAARSASLCSWSETSRAEIPCRSSRRRVCRVSSHSTTSASRSSSSTRRVTSPRFPIGVAQTASGIDSALSPALRTLRDPPRSHRPKARAPPPPTELWCQPAPCLLHHHLADGIE